MKRFTETEKWSDAWFRKLTTTQKCLWSYLVDRCDCAGVIDYDPELAEFQIGARVKAEDVTALEKQLERLPNGKLWIRSFVRFQYGQLSTECPPHKPVYAALEKHGISIEKAYAYPSVTLSLPLAKGSLTLQEKEKDKEKEKEKDVLAEDSGFEAVWSCYPKKAGKQIARIEIEAAIKAHGLERILDRTKAFAAAVAQWPEDERRFILDPVRWFKRGHYDDDPATWQRKGATTRQPGANPHQLATSEHYPGCWDIPVINENERRQKAGLPKLTAAEAAELLQTQKKPA